MQTKSIFHCALVVAVVFTALVPGARAQVGTGLDSKNALANLIDRQGEAVADKLVSIRGFEGIPQPGTWEIITHDASSPHLLRRYRIGPGFIRDEGDVDDLYPAREPYGFIDYAQLKLSSQGAFTLAEAAAKQAKMGFDSLNYTLRCREYSREPVWILHLINAKGLLVGKVHISANSGRVFRTIWIYRSDLADGPPRIEDSALTPLTAPPVAPPAGPGTTPGTTQLPTAPGTVSPPPTIQVGPGTTFVAPEPVPEMIPPGGETRRQEVPSSQLPPIPPELLKTPTTPDTPDTTIPAPPVG